MKNFDLSTTEDTQVTNRSTDGYAISGQQANPEVLKIGHFVNSCID